MLPSLIAAIAAFALAIAAAPGADTARAGSTQGGDLYYSLLIGGDTELFSRDAEGRTVQLTDNEREDILPRVSPDRTQIAFSRSATAGGGDIYLMRTDGTQVRRLTSLKGNETYPAWSPDGKRIAFAHEGGGREAEIFVIGVDGTGLQRLTFTKKAAIDMQPSFSPDGKKIVFASNRVAYGNFEIYRLDLESKRLERLTFNGSGRDGDPGDELMPEYSPDGKRIAYVSDISGSHQIWTMSSAGHKGHADDIERITRHKRSDVMFPRFSADGTKIAYSIVTLNGGREYVYTAAANGKDANRVGLGNTPDW